MRKQKEVRTPKDTNYNPLLKKPKNEKSPPKKRKITTEEGGKESLDPVWKKKNEIEYNLFTRRIWIQNFN